MIEYPSIEDLDSATKRQKRYIDKHYPGFIEWLQNKYPFCESLNELLYNYANRQEAISRPLCPVCGKPVKYLIRQGYMKTCGYKCAANDINKKNIIKRTCLEKYGVDNPAKNIDIKNKIIISNKSEAVRSKIKHTNLERYGVEISSQADVVKEKFKQTCLERYGVENYSQSQEYQSRHDEIQTKINNTKRLNHTFNSSEIETGFASYLDSQNIEYKRQYRSEEYPFNCDFYLPKYNLYIEIQASWTHGDHPYDCDEETDKDILERWKSKDTDYYKAAIETWAERDPKKREIAKSNNLNYLEIFSNDIDEVIKTFEQSPFHIFV